MMPQKNNIQEYGESQEPEDSFCKDTRNRNLSFPFVFKCFSPCGSIYFYISQFTRLRQRTNYSKILNELKINFSSHYMSFAGQLVSVLCIILTLGPRLAKNPFPGILLVTATERR